MDSEGQQIRKFDKKSLRVWDYSSLDPFWFLSAISSAQNWGRSCDRKKESPPLISGDSWDHLTGRLYKQYVRSLPCSNPLQTSGLGKISLGRRSLKKFATDFLPKTFYTLNNNNNTKQRFWHHWCMMAFLLNEWGIAPQRCFTLLFWICSSRLFVCWLDSFTDSMWPGKFWSCPRAPP